MNVICTILDKKEKKTYKLEELTPKQREEYGRKINESGMTAMGYVKSHEWKVNTYAERYFKLFDKGFDRRIKEQGRC